ncbi:MAG: malectin domain-containing carbohydrate-binding protein, partial [Planctomycetota bacterium]
MHHDRSASATLNQATRISRAPSWMFVGLLWLFVSATALAATAPVAQSMNVAVVKNHVPDPGRDEMPAIYTADATATCTMQLVSAPTNGTVTLLPKCCFSYKPNANYLGTDSFTWKVNDGTTDSNTATCNIKVRAANDRAGMLVLLVVNNLLLPKISLEVDRLKADLIADGYTAKILPMSGALTSANALVLWNNLRSEYLTPGQFMAGAILIGQLPHKNHDVASEIPSMTDISFMNLQKMSHVVNDSLQPYDYHIWVSRINALPAPLPGPVVIPSPFGDEEVLIKRALQANHDYRTGASRLPHSIYYEDIFSLATDMNSLLDLGLSTATYAPPEVGFVNGSELIHETSHGTADRYSSGAVTAYSIHDMLAQSRFVVNISCGSGFIGGVVNNQILTRGGGNVLSVGASISTFASAFDVAGVSSLKTAFRARLAAGDSWGNAYKSFFPAYTGSVVAVFYGDLSLSLSKHPGNLMPVVSSLTASTISGPAPLTVNFNASASDPDGSITNIEWFPAGYFFGKADPTVSGPSATSCSHTYTTPHRYLARVEVTDNYKARAWKTVEINIPIPSNQPVRINCGRTVVDGNARNESVYGWAAYDLTDSQGRVWLHDQPHADGYWGWDGHWVSINDNWKTSAITTTAAVTGTTDPALFQQYRTFNDATNVTTYRIPLANGGYTVKVGMADMLSTAAGQRLLNTKVEGQAWLTAFDAYQQYGAKTAGVATIHVNLSDGELTLDFSKNAAVLPGNPGIAYIEIIPDGGSTVVAPAITTAPANATVTAGQTATFIVVATGTAPFTYQWQKNGVNIVGANGSAYTTPATSTADSGATYRVVVTNSAGSVTSSASTLTVNSSTSFTTVTLQSGVNGYVGATDSYLSNGSPTMTSGGTSSTLTATHDTFGNDSRVIIAKFPIFVSEGGPVPDGATVQSATLSLYQYSAVAHSFGAHRLLKPWSEATGSWLNAAAGTPWTTAGANGLGTDINAVADGTGATTTVAGWMDIDVT